MASARSWRPLAQIEGPFRARLEEIAALNDVFSDAFTERYRRDGMVGVRVPYLNPPVWRYAIEDAADGAMLWRDDRGDIVGVQHGASLRHRRVDGSTRRAHGVSGQRDGEGDRRARRSSGCKRRARRVIGLETMPRTMDNIGFYSRARLLCRAVSRSRSRSMPRAAIAPPELLGRLSARDREDDASTECARSCERLAPGYDFTREIELTEALALGDTVLLREGGSSSASRSATPRRSWRGARARSCACSSSCSRDEASLDAMVRALCDFARRSGTRRVALRVQGEYPAMYQRLIALGARVRWTDLRMSLGGLRGAGAAQRASCCQLGDLSRGADISHRRVSRQRVRSDRVVDYPRMQRRKPVGNVCAQQARLSRDCSAAHAGRGTASVLEPADRDVERSPAPASPLARRSSYQRSRRCADPASAVAVDADRPRDRGRCPSASWPPRAAGSRTRSRRRTSPR